MDARRSLLASWTCHVRLTARYVNDELGRAGMNRVNRHSSGEVQHSGKEVKLYRFHRYNSPENGKSMEFYQKPYSFAASRLTFFADRPESLSLNMCAPLCVNWSRKVRQTPSHRVFYKVKNGRINLQKCDTVGEPS